ncbi:hypothetical protein G6F42_013550 [Rhizopus arrhizus]|nr:hypothetical protein G6F42_013550 [Rhizopus arrhizus]
MVEVNSNTPNAFTALPTEEQVEESSSITLVGTTDQILDGLLSKVGYGLFQKKLLILCGFGWLADNMWLQTIAIILPRVQGSIKTITMFLINGLALYQAHFLLA